MTELAGHDNHDSYAYVQLKAARCDLADAYRRIRDLEGQLDAVTELAIDAVRELEDEPLGSWFAKRLRSLGIGVE